MEPNFFRIVIARFELGHPDSESGYLTNGVSSPVEQEREMVSNEPPYKLK